MASPFPCIAITLLGQENPYLLRYENGLAITYEKLQINDKEEVVTISIVEDGIPYPLQYNDQYTIEFAGPGSYILRDRETKQIMVYDEYGTETQIIYAFERTDRRYWMKRAFNRIIKKENLPKQTPSFTMEEKNSEGKQRAIWKIYMSKDNGENYGVLEFRERTIYYHKIASVEKEENGVTLWTSTDYKFTLKGSGCHVTHPNCKMQELFLNPSISPSSSMSK